MKLLLNGIVIKTSPSFCTQSSKLVSQTGNKHYVLNSYLLDCAAHLKYNGSSQHLFKFFL